MTENEAIKEIETSLELAEMCTPNKEREKEIKAYKIAIQALEEIQQYRAIGTVEEFKDLKEKSVAKKVIDIQINKMQSFCEDDFGRDIPCMINAFQFDCPNCNRKIASRFKVERCPNCKQELNWQ